MFSAKLVVKKWSGFFKYSIVYIVINRTRYVEEVKKEELVVRDFTRY